MIFPVSTSRATWREVRQQYLEIPAHVTVERYIDGVVKVESRPDNSQQPTLQYFAASSLETTESTAKSGASLATMPQKRSVSGGPSGTPAKQIKTEHPEDFSNAVKKRIQSSSRTGQACDRCKVC